MKLKGFDVDLFTIPDREFGAVRIVRNGQTVGPIREHDYQFIIIQLLTEQAKIHGLLDQVHTAITAGTDEAELNRLYPLINEVLSK